MALFEHGKPDISSHYIFHNKEKAEVHNAPAVMAFLKTPLPFTRVKRLPKGDIK